MQAGFSAYPRRERICHNSVKNSYCAEINQIDAHGSRPYEVNWMIQIASHSISLVKRLAFAALYRLWLECHKQIFRGRTVIYFYGCAYETSRNISIVGSAKSWNTVTSWFWQVDYQFSGNSSRL